MSRVLENWAWADLESWKSSSCGAQASMGLNFLLQFSRPFSKSPARALKKWTGPGRARAGTGLGPITNILWVFMSHRQEDWQHLLASIGTWTDGSNSLPISWSCLSSQRERKKFAETDWNVCFSDALQIRAMNPHQLSINIIVCCKKKSLKLIGDSLVVRARKSVGTQTMQLAKWSQAIFIFQIDSCLKMRLGVPLLQKKVLTYV